ncbi:MAG: hypothetical protein LQ340_008076, partial [Diploschistes diacapsis]
GLVHTVDQILIFTSGKARATVAGKDQEVSANGPPFTSLSLSLSLPPLPALSPHSSTVCSHTYSPSYLAYATIPTLPKLAYPDMQAQLTPSTDVVIVPAGTQHQFVNVGDTPLELITVYSPAEHRADTVHKTKEEGDKLEEEGKDEAPEWSQTGKKENEGKGIVKGE